MKKLLILAMVASMALATVQPAEAKSYYGTGPVRRVLGAPWVVVGFALSLIGDVTVMPLYRGFKHYVDAPAVKGW